jgi:hypothetical protein
LDASSLHLSDLGKFDKTVTPSAVFIDAIGKFELLQS